MASDGPSDVSNEMIKAQTVGLAFQVKSGGHDSWALTDTAHLGDRGAQNKRFAALAALLRSDS